MTSFILLQNVAYEGSSLKGIFGTLEEALDHIDQMDGYCMDEFNCNRENLTPLQDHEIEHVQNATSGWLVEGPSDLSFDIFAVCVGYTQATVTRD